MGKKQDVITEIFKVCRKKNDLSFDNILVKQVAKKHGFGNPFDATKFDTTSVLPKTLLDSGFFVLHLDEGRHTFVKGVKHGYHAFERIPKKAVFDWKYRKSILNEFDTSESNIISVAGNQRIIHDFLYEDIVASPKVYNARRTKMSASYHVGGKVISADNIQMEIDFTMELHGVVTVFEGKNGFPKDFAVYQIFHPFKYYSLLKKDRKLDVKQITCCYILRDRTRAGSVLRLYNYTFDDENDMGSIRLLKDAQYNLIKR